MESNRITKVSSKDICLGTIHALGTFLFVFLMLHSAIIGIMGVYNYRWLLPYFSLPAYILCLTIGARYWIGEDASRRTSYSISTFVSVVMILPQTAFTIPSYVSMPMLRTIVSISLSILLVLFVIFKIRLEKTKYQQFGATLHALYEYKNRTKYRQIIRVVCLVSICCIMFENFQTSIMNAYGLLTKIDLAKSFLTYSPFPLSILSAILLARFMKAEFVQWKPSPDGETK